MTVKQLLAMEIGAKTGGGFPLTIKTVKKRWKLRNFSWIHQVVLFDTTGEILTDVLCDNNIPFTRNSELLIVVCELQVTENGKKLFVHEWRQQSDTEPPDRLAWANGEEERIIRGKIRHGLVCAYLQSGTKPDEEEVLFLEEFILTGKII